MKQYYTIIESLFCDIILVANLKGLTQSHLATGKGKRTFAIDPSWIRDDSYFSEHRKQINEYFKGKREIFDLPLYLKGTVFQIQVWKALQGIPHGEVCSYRDVAKTIGHPKAARAVGLANSKNPIPLIIPCHRVIGVNGKLTGFAHGLEIKSQLLNFEAKIAQK
jgi:methylated-DNA-[protein]-cysteine S-methyltransferase